MSAQSPSGVSRLRRVIVIVIIAAFSIAALAGIMVLLQGADEAMWQVLATTLTVGLYSIAALCSSTLLGRPLAVVGLVGVAVAIAGIALALWMIWGTPETEWDSGVLELLGSLITLSAGFSVVSLLLLLAERRHVAIRASLWVTVGLVAVVVGFVLFLIWGDPSDGETFARTLGVFSILAALGIVLVPVMGLLLKDPSASPEPGAAGPGVSAELADRLVAEAARRGISVEELVEPVLRA